MSLQRGRRPAGELHEHPGYAWVDHQLDPLVEIIRDIADPAWGGPTPLSDEDFDARRAEALAAVDAVEHAMKHLRWQLKNPDAW